MFLFQNKNYFAEDLTIAMKQMATTIGQMLREEDYDGALKALTFTNREIAETIRKKKGEKGDV